jgi:phenol 2-monooxygenase
MPVFQEKSYESRGFRILPTYRELPLPRLSPRPTESSGGHEKYKVVVIGVSTMFMVNSRLTNFIRAGWASWNDAHIVTRKIRSGRHLMYYDSKPGTLRAGQADGL